VNGLQFWPQTASPFASELNHLFAALLAVSAMVLGLVFGLIIYFGTKYRNGSAADRTDEHRKSWRWEVSWTTATLLMFLALFVWGGNLYARLYNPPPNALDIYVIGKQWMWKVQHPEGQAEIDELHVPVGRPVRLVMTSQDVIHSFFVPAFRVKQDVLPGRDTEIWFRATKTGVFPLLCAEYCGTDHSMMRGRIVVMRQEDYSDWLSQQPEGDDLAHEGAKLFVAQGCSGCHADSSSVHAPKLAGLYGRTVNLSDGRQVKADDGYIRDSILQPKRDIVAGYEPIMPSFSGLFDDGEIQSLTAYIRSLASEPANHADGGAK
jgi:cytochrome c oxidase subunit II